jgi:hypothetical protein
MRHAQAYRFRDDTQLKLGRRASTSVLTTSTVRTASSAQPVLVPAQSAKSVVPPPPPQDRQTAVSGGSENDLFAGSTDDPFPEAAAVRPSGASPSQVKDSRRGSVSGAACAGLHGWLPG